MEKTYKFTLPKDKEVESTNVRIEDGKLFVDVKFQEKSETKENLIKEFEKLSQPLIDFIKENYHPHCTIVINSYHAELLEGLIGFQNKKEVD